MTSATEVNLDGLPEDAPVASILGIKNPVFFRPRRSTQKAHVILKRVCYTKEPTSDEQKYGIVYFSLFAQKKIDVKPGKEILLCVESPGGPFGEQAVVLAGIINDSKYPDPMDSIPDDDAVSPIDMDSSHISVPPARHIPLKLRRGWSEKFVDRAEDVSHAHQRPTYAEIGIQVAPTTVSASVGAELEHVSRDAAATPNSSSLSAQVDLPNISPVQTSQISASCAVQPTTLSDALRAPQLVSSHTSQGAEHFSSCTSSHVAQTQPGPSSSASFAQPQFTSSQDQHVSGSTPVQVQSLQNNISSSTQSLNCFEPLSLQPPSPESHSPADQVEPTLMPGGSSTAPATLASPDRSIHATPSRSSSSLPVAPKTERAIETAHSNRSSTTGEPLLDTPFQASSFSSMDAVPANSSFPQSSNQPPVPPKAIRATHSVTSGTAEAPIFVMDDSDQEAPAVAQPVQPSSSAAAKASNNSSKAGPSAQVEAAQPPLHNNLLNGNTRDQESAPLSGHKPPPIANPLPPPSTMAPDSEPVKAKPKRKRKRKTPRSTSFALPSEPTAIPVPTAPPNISAPSKSPTTPIGTPFASLPQPLNHPLPAKPVFLATSSRSGDTSNSRGAHRAASPPSMTTSNPVPSPAALISNSSLGKRNRRMSSVSFASDSSSVVVTCSTPVMEERDRMMVPKQPSITDISRPAPPQPPSGVVNGSSQSPWSKLTETNALPGTTSSSTRPPLAPQRSLFMESQGKTQPEMSSRRTNKTSKRKKVDAGLIPSVTHETSILPTTLKRPSISTVPTTESDAQVSGPAQPMAVDQPPVTKHKALNTNISEVAPQSNAMPPSRASKVASRLDTGSSTPDSSTPVSGNRLAVIPSTLARVEPPQRKRLKPGEWPVNTRIHSRILERASSTVSGNGDDDVDPESRVEIRSVVFSSDGAHTAVCCGDKTIRIWHNRTQVEVSRLMHAGDIVDLAWLDGDAGLIVLSADDGVVGKWTRGRPGKWKYDKLLEIWGGTSATLDNKNKMCLAYCRGHIAVATPTHGLQAFTLKSGSWILERTIRENITTVKHINEGKSLICGTKEGVLWHVPIPLGPLGALAFMEVPITSLDTHPPSNQILVTLGTGVSHLLQVPRNPKGDAKKIYSHRLLSKDDSGFGARFAANGQAVIFGNVNGYALVWDTQKGAVVYTLEHDEEDEVRTISVFHGSNKMKRGNMVTGTKKGELVWWFQPVSNVPTGDEQPNKRLKLS